LKEKFYSFEEEYISIYELNHDKTSLNEKTSKFLDFSLNEFFVVDQFIYEMSYKNLKMISIGNLICEGKEISDFSPFYIEIF